MPDENTDEKTLTQDDLSAIEGAVAATKTEDDYWDEAVKAEKEGADPAADFSEQDPPAADKAPGEDEEPQSAKPVEGKDPDVAPSASKSEADAKQPAAEQASGDGPDDSQGDIWANATPEQRAQLDELNQKLAREQKRTGALQSQLDTRSSTSAPRQPRRKAKGAKDFNKRVDAAVAAIDGIADDLPENVHKTLKDTLSELAGGVKDLHQTEDARHEQESQDYTDRLLAEQNVLEAEIPGWQKYLGENGQAFNDWANDPGRSVAQFRTWRENQGGIVNGKATAELISAFKEHMGHVEKPAPAAEAKGETDDGKPDRKQELDEWRRRQVEGLNAPGKTGASKQVSSFIPDDADEDTIWNGYVAEEAKKAREQRA